MSDRELIELHLVWCVAGGLAVDSTVDDRGKVLARVSRDVGPLLEVNADQLSAWFANDQWSASTRATYFRHLSGFYRWCEETDRIPASPMRKLRQPRTPKGLPRPASLDVFRLVMDQGTNPFRRAVLLAAYAGLRAGEITALKREHVTEERLIVINGKGGKDASLPCHPAIWADLRDAPPGYVAINALGRPYAEGVDDQLSRNSVKYLTRLVGYRVTLHQFRHLYATQLLRQTGNLRTVQQLMRHASPSTTAIYTEIVDEERNAAIRGLTF